jgi:hypothetical protein
VDGREGAARLVCGRLGAERVDGREGVALLVPGFDRGDSALLGRRVVLDVEGRAVARPGDVARPVTPVLGVARGVLRPVTRSEGRAVLVGAAAAPRPVAGLAVAVPVGRRPVTGLAALPVAVRVGVAAESPGLRCAVRTVEPLGDSLYPVPARGERRATETPRRPPEANTVLTFPRYVGYPQAVR